MSKQNPAPEQFGVGHIAAIHLQRGSEIHVREHQFLAATGNVEYTFERVKGVANMLFGGTGFFIDKFHLAQGEGILWLHGYGNIFEKNLAAGEAIDVEPGGWLSHWSGVALSSKEYKELGEVTAWRVTLWEGSQLLGEQKSFLW